MCARVRTEQAKCVEFVREIDSDLVVEAVWFPRFSPKRNRHRLAELIQLQTARATCSHDRCIVNHFRFDVALLCTDHKVCMSCCAFVFSVYARMHARTQSAFNHRTRTDHRSQ